MNAFHSSIVSALFLLLAGAGSAHASGDHDHGHGDDHGGGHADQVEMSADMADRMQVKTAIAGPGQLRITRELTGRVHTDPARVSRVRPRYAGLIQSVSAQPWTRVTANQVLARVQSNDSLQSYDLRAPIGGWVVTRNAQVGEVTGSEPLFVIADLSELWVEFDVFDHDLDVVRVGQTVDIFGLHDNPVGQGVVDQLSPLAIHAAQSVRARVIAPNPDGALRPGQYVHGELLVEAQPVDLLIPRSAVQRREGRSVVFEQVDDGYAQRPVELGRGNAESVEVLSGLEPGARVVVGNSYLMKADLDKSGASHQH
ncbi:efflux RND transporter periplasmic adaptor subunit [uncultured Abyssibacter sp.]|uniref:efflux RND transporter periplasmic adaptor subunit n=1 Tax=uncultured Abyssibacter sp. TaxID=2320202 RepID=UPI0032B1926C